MKKIVSLLSILLLPLTASAALADSTIGNLQPGGMVQTGDFGPVVRAGCVTEGDCKVQFGSAAAQFIGTSGATLGLLNTANTYSAIQTFLSGDLVAADPQFTGNSILLPSGTTSQRPGSPGNGMMRYNSSLNTFEGYAGGAWGPLGGSSGSGAPGGSAGSLQVNGGSGSLAAYPGLTCASHKWVNALDATGALTSDCVQPGFGDLSGVAANSQIPVPTTTGLGGILGLASAVTHQVVQYIDTSGVQHLAQVAFSDLAGALSYGQMPNSGVTAGSYTSANITVNAEGIVTLAANGSGGGGGSLTVGTSSIAGGTTTKVLFDNAGVLGEYLISGSGNVAMTSGATLTGASVNGVALNSAGSSSLFLNQAGGYTSPAGSGGLTVGTTTISSGTTGKVEFNNAGVLGEYSTSGTGNVAMTASPNFTGTVNGAAATWSGVDTALNFSATGTGADQLPAGSSAQRPGSPVAGMIRYNSTATPTVESYINGVWQTVVSGTPTNATVLLTTNPISGATAEYPFTDGSGTSVADITGNGNTGTLSSGSAPTWTTYGLSFNTGSGTNNQYVQTPIKTWRTLVLNVCPTTYAQNSTGNFTASLFSSFAGTPSGGGIDLVSSGPAYNNLASFASFYPGIYATGTSFNTGAQTGTAGCPTIVYTLDTSDHIYVNGTEISYQSQGSSASSVTTTSTGYVLGGAAASNFSFIGTINYAIFYPGVLTSSQVKSVTTFINAQVLARQNYPMSTQPATASGNQLICNGDSLTSAINGTSTWCNNSNLPTTNTYNKVVWAISSDTAQNNVGANFMRTLSSVSPGGGRNICNHWLGTNDVSVSNQFTAAQTWAALQRLAIQDRAAGCFPVVGTMISRTGLDTQKNALNALIRANWQQSSFGALDDIAAVPGLGADGANTNVNCFSGDHIHLNGPGAGSCYNSLSGYGVVGANLGNLVNSLDGSTASNPTITASNAYAQTFADNYVLQTPTASATDTLPDCTGLTGLKRTIVNGSSSFSITVNTSASQTITGSNSIGPNGKATFTCELTSPAAAGNYWLAEGAGSSGGSSGVNPVLLPSSAYTADTAGNLFPYIYSGGGGNASAHDAGWGVAASLGSDVTLELRFQMPPAIPGSGTFKLVSYCLANATSGVAKYTPSDAMVAAAASPSAATLTADTQVSNTWSAADQYVVSKTTLSGAPAADNVSVVAVAFNHTGWTLAQIMSCRWEEVWE
jgi:hypothetical protein